MKHINHPFIPLSLLSELALEENDIKPMNSVRIKLGTKHMLKNLIILCCLLLLWFFSDRVLANEGSEKQTNEEEHTFSSLWLESQDDSEKVASEALSTTVSMSVSGPILRAKVKQTFRNPSQVWLEGVYSFPLPEEAAVDRLRMVIGERVVEGEIQEKQTAKKTYEKARANGQRTSLLNHHRTNIFTTSVANIGPQENISIEFEYQQVLDFRDHQYHLRFPMVSTPQYTTPRSRLQKDFIAPINFIKPSNTQASNPVSISVDIKPGFPIELPSSISHPISVNTVSPNPDSEAHYKVDVKGTAALSNRDFILSWRLKPSSKPMVSFLHEEFEGESYGLMMVMPPKSVPDNIQSMPRELIWILDISGSMQGESIKQARSAMLKALSKLRPEDYFNIICFNTNAWKLFPNSRAGNRDNLNLAREKMLKLEANGGTDMRPALSLALDQNNNSERLRQVVFVTDGAVSNEAELFTQIQNNLGSTRLFTVGIGSAPNSYFMRKAAVAGRGSFTYISQPHEVNNKIDQLLRKLEAPALTNLGVDLNNPTASVLPRILPDVYIGEPVYISFKAEHLPSYAELTGTLSVSSSDGFSSQESSLRLPLKSAHQHEGIAVEWARRKLSELVELHKEANSNTKPLIRNEAIELALAHHQVSRFTSLVAVDQSAERAGGLLNTKQIPANSPKGFVNQASSSSNGIRLAKTATDLPFHLWLGTTLFSLSVLLWFIHRLVVRIAAIKSAQKALS